MCLIRIDSEHRGRSNADVGKVSMRDVSVKKLTRIHFHKDDPIIVIIRLDKARTDQSCMKLAHVTSPRSKIGMTNEFQVVEC